MQGDGVKIGWQILSEDGIVQWNVTSLAMIAVGGGAMISTIAQANPASNLTVVVNGLQNQQGQVCVSLFANSQGFPDRGERAVRAQCVSVAKGQTAVTFRNLALGNYAVAVFHDRNGNGVLDRNFLGIPKEGFGFSRNPTIRTGAPQFSEVAVLVAGSNNTAQIQLQYLL